MSAAEPDRGGTYSRPVCMHTYSSKLESDVHDTIWKYLTCNQKTGGQPAQSTTRDQKLKRNNDKKIKQTDQHNKSEKQSRGKVPEVYGGNRQRLVKKVGFEPRVKKRS